MELGINISMPIINDKLRRLYLTCDLTLPEIEITFVKLTGNLESYAWDLL